MFFVAFKILSQIVFNSKKVDFLICFLIHSNFVSKIKLGGTTTMLLFNKIKTITRNNTESTVRGLLESSVPFFLFSNSSRVNT